MSRIGKLPIQIPAEVTLEVKGNMITVKGPKGELSQEIRPEVSIKLEGDKLQFEADESNKDCKAFWGLSRALVANMIAGVISGYEKKLELVGVGYRVAKSSTGISLTLGYSHPVEFEAPEGITLGVEDNKNIIISGINKQLVGQTAAKIRSFRKPEPYKGKGVRYSDEHVKTKPGKAGKV